MVEVLGRVSVGSFRWYVAQTLPGLERTALYHLDRAGIAAYAPAAGKERLFPGYAFVELAATTEAGIVNRTRGIRKMLPIHAVEPLPLPPNFVDDLRDRIRAGDFEGPGEGAFLRKFIKDEEVAFISGPMQDKRGRFCRYHKGAGVVLTALLGREMEVKVPLHQLAPLAKAREPESRSVRAA